MHFTSELPRILWASVLCAVYAGLCLVIWRRSRIPFPERAPGMDGFWLVTHASQTGYAAQLATAAAAALRTAGYPVHHCELGQLTPGLLRSTQRALFLVSTYGEGDAPDQALRFAHTHLSVPGSLPNLRYGLLALGDSGYSRFCAFGRRLDAWLSASGAQSLFARIEVDRGDPEAIARWFSGIQSLGATAEFPVSEAAFQPWKIVARKHLNPGSPGGPVFHLALQPADDRAPFDWQSGDLVEIEAPIAAASRLYTIASLPAQGALQLLVRERPGGLVSPLLCRGSDSVQLRVRRHPGFHLAGNAERPLVLIGNGTGVAGLRAHFHARVLAGQASNWLIFGERVGSCDYFFRDEIERWLMVGHLAHLDLCFSREPGPIPYVQHALAARAGRLRAWVKAGAAIYVCGDARGMAEGVDEVLERVLGQEQYELLRERGRYQRDVY